MLAVGAAAYAPAATADSNLAALTSQRAAMQAQVGRLGADQAAALEALLQVQDRLGNLRRQVAHNQAELNTLEARRSSLEAQVTAARARISTERAALGTLARQQYKARDQNSAEQVFFGSNDLNQVVNRVVANRAVSDRQHTMLTELRAVEASLGIETADLARRQAEVSRLQGELASRRSSLQAAAADYHARIDTLSASSADLLGQISNLNSQIAAATKPPPPPPGNFSQGQEQVIAIIRAAASRYGQDGNRLVRVANCESSLNPRAYDAVSGASGLFQFMPGTFYGNGGHDIWDATDQSNVAARMFSQGHAGDWSCS
ncbi:MAG: transglycosylase SLT domain-containing protein [Candidatus Dormibacteraeota bacterium]|nr:transglycosylase SLT domain-containing protein [Candidatus Dormibacteraeota bacterium]